MKNKYLPIFLFFHLLIIKYYCSEENKEECIKECLTFCEENTLHVKLPCGEFACKTCLTTHIYMQLKENLLKAKCFFYKEKEHECYLDIKTLLDEKKLMNIFLHQTRMENLYIFL